MARALSLAVTRIPDLRTMVEEIRTARERAYQQATDRVVPLIRAAITSQGGSVGASFPGLRGGGPALLSLASRFSVRITPERFSIVCEHPWASVLQWGGTLKSGGRRFAVPFPGVTGRPGDYRNTSVRPAKRQANAFVIFGREESGVRPLFFLTPELLFPRRVFLDWFDEFRLATEEEIERVIDETLSRLGEVAA